VNATVRYASIKEASAVIIIHCRHYPAKGAADNSYPGSGAWHLWRYATSGIAAASRSCPTTGTSSSSSASSAAGALRIALSLVQAELIAGASRCADHRRIGIDGAAVAIGGCGRIAVRHRFARFCLGIVEAPESGAQKLISYLSLILGTTAVFFFCKIMLFLGFVLKLTQ